MPKQLTITISTKNLRLVGEPENQEELIQKFFDEHVKKAAIAAVHEASDYDGDEAGTEFIIIGNKRFRCYTIMSKPKRGKGFNAVMHFENVKYYKRKFKGFVEDGIMKGSRSLECLPCHYSELYEFFGESAGRKIFEILNQAPELTKRTTKIKFLNREFKSATGSYFVIV